MSNISQEGIRINKVARRVCLIYIGVWLIVGLAGIIMEEYYKIHFSGYLTIYALAYGIIPGGIVWIILRLLRNWEK